MTMTMTMTENYYSGEKTADQLVDCLTGRGCPEAPTDFSQCPAD